MEKVCPLSMMSNLTKSCVKNCQFWVKTNNFEGCAMLRYFMEDNIPIYEKIDSLEDGYS